MLIAVLVVIVAALAAARAQLQVVTVFEFQRAVVYRRGRLGEVLGAGRRWLPRRGTLVRVVDIRPAVVTVPGQEVLTADGVAVKLTLAARFAVTDPVAALNGVADYGVALYTALQLAAREVVGGVAVEQLLAERAAFGERLGAIARPEAELLGLTLEAVNVKDLTFPGDLKRVFAQVVEARQEGLAALERARGETAAIRSLANVAKALEANPALLQLRLLQTLETATGNTIVLGLPLPRG